MGLFHFTVCVQRRSSLFHQSLAPPINHSLTSPQAQDQPKPTSTRTDSMQSPKGVDKGIDLSLPERPQHSFEPARRLMLVSRQRSRDQGYAMAELPPNDGKHTTSREESPRPQKRRKDGEADDNKPSLLSRLGSTSQRVPVPMPPRPSLFDRTDSTSVVGFSIKGAAKMGNNLAYSDRESSSSLLERLDGGSSTQGMERQGQGNRRKRGKPS